MTCNRRAFLVLNLVVSCSLAGSATAAVLDFEDLAEDATLWLYGGFTWEGGLTHPMPLYPYWCAAPTINAHGIDQRCLFNGTGDTLMAIDLGSPIDVQGAFFARYGSPIPWGDATPSQIRALGYSSGVLVQTTDWFTDLDTQPDWFAMNLTQIDRIVIEAVPQEGLTQAFYCMDNFTYTVPEPTSLCLAIAGGMLGFAWRRRR